MLLKKQEIQQSANLEKILKKQKINLNDIWINLLEEYYTVSNKREYNIALRKLKKAELLRNKIVTCQAAVLLLEYYYTENSEIANKILTDFGYKINKGLSDIKRQILRDNSTLKILDKVALKHDEDDEINFWSLVAKLEDAIGRQIDVDKITLSHWLEMVKTIKEKTVNNKRNGKR